MTKKEELLNFLRENWEIDLPDDTEVPAILHIIDDTLFKEFKENQPQNDNDFVV